MDALRADAQRRGRGAVLRERIAERIAEKARLRRLIADGLGIDAGVALAAEAEAAAAEVVEGLEVPAQKAGAAVVDAAQRIVLGDAGSPSPAGSSTTGTQRAPSQSLSISEE